MVGGRGRRCRSELFVHMCVFLRSTLSLCPPGRETHTGSAIIAIGITYGDPSTEVFLCGGAHRQLYAGGGGGRRGAALAIAADCEAGADAGSQAVRPAQPRGAVD